MGVVEDADPEVHEVKVGDRVSIPFTISCGRCWFCRHQLWSQCDRSNPKGKIGGAFGYTQALGGYDGGQAEYVRVPYANTEALNIPDHVTDEQAVFLCDVFPTGYFGVDIAGVQPGDDVAVFGAGPVGYFAVLSAVLRGAARVFCIDHYDNRLEKVKTLGAETINFDQVDPVQAINDATKGRGVICVDAVGFEAVGHHNHAYVKDPSSDPQNPVQVLTWISQVARKFSTVGIPGVYGSAYDGFPLGTLFNRELQLRMGQCPVKNYNEQLMHLIEVGRVDPTPLISQTMKLADAPKAYQIFDKRSDATKIIFHP